MSASTAILLSVLSALPSAGAGSALWLSFRLDSQQEEALRASVERSTTLSLYEPDEAQVALEVVARALGPDPAKVAETALVNARGSYLELKLQDALRYYEQALQAILRSDRAGASAGLIARIHFEQAVVLEAARRQKESEEKMAAAVTIDTQLSADPAVYGPPVIRAVAAAKARRERAFAVRARIDRSPADAIVRLDGQVVPPGDTLEVKGAGPHLITAERVGYRARSMLVRAQKAQLQTAIVLEPASGPLLAAQTRAAWRKLGDEALSRELALSVARVLEVNHVLEASLVGTSSVSGDEIDLVLRSALGEVIRSVRGRRLPWEPWPYAVLTEALEGRNLQPGELTLTLSVPSVVAPGTAIELQVRVADKNRRLASLQAQCGASKAKITMEGYGSSRRLSVLAPSAQGKVSCVVQGLDRSGAPLVRAPPEGVIGVRIGALGGRPWYKSWWVWSILGVAVTAAAIGTVVAAQPEPTEAYVLRIIPPGGGQ